MAKGYPSGAAWRDSARTIRFFIVDYRACFPLLALLFFPSLKMLIFALVAMCFFVLLERFGYSVVVFMRVARGVIGGPRRIAQPWWRRPKVN